MSEDDGQTPPESLLPYEQWQSDAMRQVMVRALAYVAENGLPGEHHFYITFRTDAPGVKIPPRLLAQYPHEMTIVLQHQFWDLKVDAEANVLHVTLSFSGVPSPLHIPFAAIVAFADPQVRYGTRFLEPEAGEAETATSVAQITSEVRGEPAAEQPKQQVVSLDAFRRRPPPTGRDH